TCGYRWSTNAQPGGNERRTWIVRYSVFVHSNERAAQCFISIFTSDVLLNKAQQEQVVISAFGYHIKTAVHKHFCHGAGVIDNFLLIILKAWLHGFFKAHRFCSNNVY